MSQSNELHQPYQQPPWPPSPGKVYGAPPPRRRRRRWIIPATLAALVAVGAVGAALIVGGGDGTTTGIDTPIAGPGISAATGKATKKIGYGTSASIIAAALGCSNAHPTPAASPGDVDMGNEPDDSIVCTFNEESVQISTWKTASGQSASLASAKLLVTGFGMEVYFAQGAGWVAGLDGDAVKPEADRKVAEAIAAKLGGKVIHWAST